MNTEKFPEQYQELLTAIERGPIETSYQEITEARFSLFSRVNHLGDLQGHDIYENSRRFGSIGAVVLVAGVTPVEYMDMDDKLGLLQASADFIDREGQFIQPGRSLVLKQLKSYETQLFKQQALTGITSPSPLEGRNPRTDLYNTYIAAKRSIPRRTPAAYVQQVLDEVVESLSVPLIGNGSADTVYPERTIPTYALVDELVGIDRIIE